MQVASTSDPIVVRTKFWSRFRARSFCTGRAWRRCSTDHRAPPHNSQAGPGYGRAPPWRCTFAPAHTSSSGTHVWHRRRSHVFMSHLVWSMRSAYPRMGGSALAIISQGLDATARRRAVEALANDMLDMLQADAVLVIDDYHAASRNPEIHDIVSSGRHHAAPDAPCPVHAQAPALSAIPLARQR